MSSNKEFPPQMLYPLDAIAILNGFTRLRRVKPFTRSKLTWQLLENDLGLLYGIVVVVNQRGFGICGLNQINNKISSANANPLPILINKQLFQSERCSILKLKYLFQQFESGLRVVEAHSQTQH